MKPKCPTGCGRDIGANYVLCEACFALVPRPLINEIAQAKIIIRETRSATVMQAAFRAEGEAKRRAIQYVIDQLQKQVPA